MVGASMNYLLRSLLGSSTHLCRVCYLSKLGEITKLYNTASGISLLNSSSLHSKSNLQNVQHIHPSLVPVHVPVTCIQRYASAVTGEVSNPGILKRFVKKMGWLEHSRSKLKRSGFILYETIGEKVSTMDFFEVCELPDTFYSWFLVTELHVWMLMVRLMAEGQEGRYTRSAVVDALWQDVEMRAKKLGDGSPTARNEQIQEIASSFQSALFSYDEGLLGDDKQLASALWRRLFSKNCNDPERLECCVHYVRKQIAHLDSHPRREFMLNCHVEWLPLLERSSD